MKIVIYKNGENHPDSTIRRAKFYSSAGPRPFFGSRLSKNRLPLFRFFRTLTPDRKRARRMTAIDTRGRTRAKSARPLGELPTKSGERAQYPKTRTDMVLFLRSVPLSVTLARATSPEVRVSLSSQRTTQPCPNNKRFLFGSLREGAAAQGARLGESAVDKRYKVVTLARRGLLPSRSARHLSLSERHSSHIIKDETSRSAKRKTSLRRTRTATLCIIP